MSVRPHAPRRAVRQAATTRSTAASRAAVCVVAALLQPAHALRPEHQLAQALTTKAALFSDLGAYDVLNGPHAPAAAAISVGVDTSADTTHAQSKPKRVRDASTLLASTLRVAKPRTDQASDPQQQLSAQERLANSSNQSARDVPDVGTHVNHSVVSHAVARDAIEMNRSSVYQRGVLELASMLQVLGGRLKASFSEARSSPWCMEEDAQGKYIGCKGSCSCRWYEQCYSKKTSDAPFEDSGVCEMSMSMMAAITVMTAGCVLLLTVSARLILQHHEFIREHRHRDRERASRRVPPPPGRKSFVDEMAERRALVHEKGLVQETLRNLPADLLSGGKASEVLAKYQEKLRVCREESDTLSRCSSQPEASPEAASSAGRMTSRLP